MWANPPEAWEERRYWIDEYKSIEDGLYFGRSKHRKAREQRGAAKQRKRKRRK